MTPDTHKVIGVRQTLIQSLREGLISFWMIDECDYSRVSASENFRAHFRTLGEDLDGMDLIASCDLARSLLSPPRYACSGTIAEFMRDATIKDCGLRNPKVIVGSAERSNLTTAQLTIKREVSFKMMVYEQLAPLVLKTVGSKVLVYVLTPAQVNECSTWLAAILAARSDSRSVFKVSDVLDASEKREQIERFRAASDGAVAVVNDAGSQGLDVHDLFHVFKCTPPPSLADVVQVDGRFARLPGQRGLATQLYKRTAAFAVAFVLSADSEKLAAFIEAIEREELVRFCSKSYVAYRLGEAARPRLASPSHECCAVCTRLALANGDWTQVARTGVREKLYSVEKRVKRKNGHPANRSADFSRESRRDG